MFPGYSYEKKATRHFSYFLESILDREWDEDGEYPELFKDFIHPRRPNIFISLRQAGIKAMHYDRVKHEEQIAGETEMDIYRETEIDIMNGVAEQFGVKRRMVYEVLTKDNPAQGDEYIYDSDQGFWNP